MTVDPLRSPQSALDLQLDLLRVVDDRALDHARRLERLDEDRIRIDDAQRSDGPVRRDLTAPAVLRDPVHAGLAGHTMWVSAEMAAMIERAAAEIPTPDGGRLSLAGLLAHRSGTAWIAGDPMIMGASSGSGDVHRVIGISWSIDLNAEQVPMLHLWPWLTGDPAAGRCRRLPILGLMSVCAVGADIAPMLDVDMEMVVDGEMAEWDQGWATPEFDALRWMLTLWVFAAQVLPPHIEPANRALRRRARRQLGETRPEWDEVHVMALRTLTRDSGDATAGESRHHHQWVVRGHWRWQPCGPGRQHRRLTWVRPHVKGPQGAPLIEAEIVSKLIR